MIGYFRRTYGVRYSLSHGSCVSSARIEQKAANFSSPIYFWSSASMNRWCLHLLQVSIIFSMLLVVPVVFLLEAQASLQPMFFAVMSFIIMMFALLGVFIKVPQ